MNKKEQRVKANALRFVDDSSACFAQVQGEDPKLSMIAYSGGIIKNHWYWGNVAFDLSGVKLPKGKSPILEEHDIGRKIAVANKYSIDNNQLAVKDAVFLNTSAATEFKELAAQDFPFQASIRGVPVRVETVEEGASTKVNGFNLSGPGAVWREWELKESSVCTFGADSNTASGIQFAEEDISYFVQETKKQGDEEMPFDLEKFKLENPDAFSDIEKGVRDTVVREMEDKFAQEKTGFQATIDDMTGKVDSYQSRFTEMEKAMLKVKEKEMRLEASKIFSEKFSDAELPERLFTKIEKLVPYTNFVKDDEFDVAAFGAALDVELKEWKEFSQPVVVQGSGSHKKQAAGDSFTDEDAEALVADMLKLAA